MSTIAIVAVVVATSWIGVALNRCAHALENLVKLVSLRVARDELMNAELERISQGGDEQ